MWRGLKKSIRVAFAEGLKRYDVKRGRGLDGIVTRPALEGEGADSDWMPKHQVHLQGEDVEKKEAEEVHQHYAWKNWMEHFGGAYSF